MSGSLDTTYGSSSAIYSSSGPSDPTSTPSSETSVYETTQSETVSEVENLKQLSPSIGGSSLKERAQNIIINLDVARAGGDQQEIETAQRAALDFLEYTGEKGEVKDYKTHLDRAGRQLGLERTRGRTKQAMKVRAKWKKNLWTEGTQNRLEMNHLMRSKSPAARQGAARNVFNDVFNELNRDLATDASRIEMDLKGLEEKVSNAIKGRGEGFGKRGSEIRALKNELLRLNDRVNAPSFRSNTRRPDMNRRINKLQEQMFRGPEGGGQLERTLKTGRHRVRFKLALRGRSIQWAKTDAVMRSAKNVVDAKGANDKKRASRVNDLKSDLKNTKRLTKQKNPFLEQGQ